MPHLKGSLRTNCAGMAAGCETALPMVPDLAYGNQNRFKSVPESIRQRAREGSSSGALQFCPNAPSSDCPECIGLSPCVDFRSLFRYNENLFRFDVVKASFIPSADIRALQELSSYHLKLSYMRTAEKNRYRNSMTISRIRIDCVP